MRTELRPELPQLPARPTVAREPRPSDARIEAHLAKIIVSSAFVRSLRLGGFLRFVVENALRGQTDHLKEYVIGVEVYRRPASFDPAIDPIVRVEARRLRATLAKYYGSEGRRDLIRIEIPKGRYVPVFTVMPSPDPGGASAWPHALAVLPFENLSPDPEQEFFCDGLTEELINALSQFDGLRVTARSSVHCFKANHQDVRQIGAQLNVQNVLEGSVRKSGDKLRITAMLTSAADGYQVWSERYDCEAKDLLAVQDEISWAIVKPLATRLTGERSGPVLAAHAGGLATAA